MGRAKFNELELAMMSEYDFVYHEMVAIRKKFKSYHRLMVRRMTDPNNKDYHNYGARFNEVFDYRAYEDFYVDYFPLFCQRAWEKGLENITTERLENDRSYLKGNIDFLTRQEQALNTRKVMRLAALDPHGKLHIHKGARDFAGRMGFSPWRIIDYLNPSRRGNPRHGWQFESLSPERYDEIIQLRERILNVLYGCGIERLRKVVEEIEAIEVEDDIYEAIADYELQRQLMPARYK